MCIAMIKRHVFTQYSPLLTGQLWVKDEFTHARYWLQPRDGVLRTTLHAPSCDLITGPKN